MDKNARWSRLYLGVPEEHRALFQERRLEANVGQMYWFSIYIIILQVALNVIERLKPGGAGNPAYAPLSLSLLLVGVVYCALLTLVRKGRIKGHGIKTFLVQSLLYIYLVIQMIICTVSIVTHQDVHGYIIAILIVGLVPVISPAQSLTSIILSFVYMFVSLYATRDLSGMRDPIMLTNMWTNLIIITGLVAFISVFIYRMYVRGFLNHVELERSNEDLRRANEEMEMANGQLEVQATTDHATGVLNRHALSQDLERMWQTTTIRDRELVIAIFDIDYFKDYNDGFGHLAGDDCLWKVANCLMESFRRMHDKVYRYGGEEFLVVFDAEIDDALTLVERARERVEQMHIPHANTSISPYVTISAGVCATRLSPGVSAYKALKIADEALYESKEGGRNRVTMKSLDA